MPDGTGFRLKGRADVELVDLWNGQQQRLRRAIALTGQRAGEAVIDHQQAADLAAPDRQVDAVQGLQAAKELADRTQLQ